MTTDDSLNNDQQNNVVKNETLSSNINNNDSFVGHSFTPHTHTKDNSLTDFEVMLITGMSEQGDLTQLTH